MCTQELLENTKCLCVILQKTGGSVLCEWIFTFYLWVLKYLFVRTCNSDYSQETEPLHFMLLTTFQLH